MRKLTLHEFQREVLADRLGQLAADAFRLGVDPGRFVKDCELHLQRLAQDRRRR